MLLLGFFNPMLLWAMPLAAVPIIIHLLNRRRFNKVPWAAMEYLLRAMKRNRRRMQMEHWIILLLRTLAVIFLVFLVTRPQMTGGGGILRARTHHIVCLDDSASMAQREGATDVFKSGVNRIHKLVEKLIETSGGDLFTLIRSSQTGRPPLMFAVSVGPDLKKRVRDKLIDPVGDSTLEPGKFLEAAHKWATEKKKDAGDIQYYMVTDSRYHDFMTDGKPAVDVLRHLEEMDPAHAQMTMLLVGPKETDNLGITAVRRRDRLAMARASVTLEVEVTNFGDDNSEGTELSVSIDETSQVNRPVPVIPPGGRVVIDIEHTFREPGFHGVVATLKKDRYPVDDTGVLALEVVATSPVLVVDGDPGQTVEEGESFYLSSALDTGGDVLSGITVEAIGTPSLPEYDLKHINMIFLANISAPRPEVVAKLEKFVADGGGLMMFLGNQLNEKSYNENLYKEGKGLLPLRITTLKGNADDPDHGFVADNTHFAIQRHPELLDLILSKMVNIGRYYEMEEDANAPVAIPLRVKGATGSPLLVSKTFQQGGYSIVFGSTADLAWTDLCQTPAYLVLLQEIHKHATRVHSIAPYNLRSNGTLTIELDPAEYRADVLIRGTGAKSFAGGTFTALDRKEENGSVMSTLTVPMTEITGLGLFEVILSPHRGEQETRLLARTAPAEEGRMQRMNKEGWRKNYPKELEDRLNVIEESNSKSTGTGTGEGEIWRLLGLTLLVVLLLETLLAWRFGRR